MSPVFIDVLERALARNPADRYKSAGEFGNALAAAAGVPHLPDVSEASIRQRHWQRFAVAAAAVAVLLVGLTVYQRSTEPRPDGTATEVVTNPPVAANTPAKAPSPVNASYNVAASFYASRNGRDVRLTQGSRVRPGDELFAVINASEQVFVYIINRDEAGQSFLLFPLPGFSPGNPIPTGQMIRFPGTRNGQQIYWSVTSAGGREHFFLYVTPQRLVEFEQLLAALPRAELGTQRQQHGPVDHPP